MSFRNRVSEHPNRRKLTVVDVKNNASGQLGELVVDMVRAEGNVIQEGTQLSAEQINEAIREIVKEEIEKAIKKGTIGPSNSGMATTMPVWRSDNTIATTKFVWDVLVALEHKKIEYES